MSINPTRIADVAVGTSVTSAVASWFSVANEVAQFIAAIIAIFSGLAALWYYLKKK